MMRRLFLWYCGYRWVWVVDMEFKGSPYDHWFRLNSGPVLRYEDGSVPSRPTEKGRIAMRRVPIHKDNLQLAKSGRVVVRRTEFMK